MKLAFMTIGILHEPLGNPRVQGFVDRIPAVYGAADSSQGFIDRSERNLENFEHSWGPIIAPTVYGGDENSNRMPTTLSLWDDLESVAAFAYHGHHGEAMAKRKEWFETHEFPTYVAWWTDEKLISWSEACKRLDHLHEHGSTSYAFNFVLPFDHEGKSCRLNAALVKEKVAANAEE